MEKQQNKELAYILELLVKEENFINNLLATKRIHASFLKMFSSVPLSFI